MAQEAGYFSKSVKILSPAKLNLYLEVLNKRQDGYHNISTLFERISLSDEITIKETSANCIVIKSDSKDIPGDKRNLAYKAAALLKDGLQIKKGVVIEIKKRIPVGAGLGGGSSNAASVLLGLNKLWNLKLSQKKFFEYGSCLGSDVAFFLSGASFAIGSGRGEKIKPLAHFKKKFWHVIVVPDIMVSTRRIYRKLDNFRRKGALNKTAGISIRQLSKGQDVSLGKIIFNRLEEATFKRYPKVKELKEALLKRGVQNTAMSGSGGAVFGVVNSRKEGIKMLRSFKQDKDTVAFVVRTL